MLRLALYLCLLVASRPLFGTQPDTALASKEEQPTVSLSGRITSDGKPLEDAMLLLSGTRKKETFPISATSDARGRYVFFNLSAGEYTLRVEKYHFLSREQALEYDGKNAIRLDLTLAPGAIGFGKVPPLRGATEERIFYATDRLLVDQGGTISYADARNNDGILSYGFADINVPTHGGNAESVLAMGADRVYDVVVDKVVPENETNFWTDARLGGKEALVFIHGFQNSFDYAARRLGVLKHDLHFTGPAILYSWASMNDGSFRGYTGDESSIGWSEPHFKRFLISLSHAGFTKIHFIAHSMGNRLLLSGLDGCVKLPAVDEVIFAAPDVDLATFREALTRIRPHVGRLTLYGSSKDRALLASRFVHAGLPRAGLLNPILVNPVLDTIDASKVDLSFIHHSYFVDATAVEQDIELVLLDKLPPRPRLQKQQNGSGIFWSLQ